MLFIKILKLAVFVFGLLLTLSSAAQEDDVLFQSLKYEVEVDEKNQVEQLKRSIEIDSTNTRLLLILGSVWESQMQFDSAAIAYQRAIEIDSTCVRCKQLFANVLASKGMVKKSIDLYSQVLRIDTSSRSARINLARLLKRENQFHQAIDHFSWLLQSDSSNFYLWEQIGDCALRIDSSALGLEAYSKSFELNPLNMSLAVKLVNGYIKFGLPPLFILPIVETAYQYDSTYLPLIRTKGYLHFLNQDYKNSETWFSKAFSMGDSSRFSLKFLGISLFHRGSFTKSVDLLGKAYGVDTTDNVLNFVLAKSLIEVGERNMAIDILDKTQELLTPKPKEIALLYATRAEAYFRGANFAQAAIQYSKAYEYDPKSTLFLLELGKCYYGTKELKKALEYFEQYVRIVNKEPLAKTREIESAKWYIERINKELFFMDIK